MRSSRAEPIKAFLVNYSNKTSKEINEELTRLDKGMHLIALNLLLTRMTAQGMLSRSRRGKAYVYSLPAMAESGYAIGV
jgi:predicted transcriptional regulator